VPELVYSAVELGRIGMNEDDAEDAELEPAVGFAAFETNPRALGQDDTDGFVRLIADMDSGALLGAEVVGYDAGEMIHSIAQQFGHEDALARFAATFYNHPARTEEIQNATETLAAKWGLAEQVFGE
jgi:dihydrolipoamide dehydrogenase